MILEKLKYSDVLLKEIFENDITIYEDVQGSKIFVNYDGVDFTITQKTFNNKPISLIDLSLQKYYNKAYNYLISLSDRVKDLLPKNWYFVFEYFPDNEPANIKYNKVPKNNLILTAIVKNKKYEYNNMELLEFSNLLGVDCLPIIFQGKLTDAQKTALKYFLTTSEEDLEFVFGEKNFAYFFYKLLNTKLNNSYLMEEDVFQDNIERLIIRINNNDRSFILLNPMYKRYIEDNITEYTEVYTLILINFLNYCQNVNLHDLKLIGTTVDELYLSLICKLYNMYMNDTSDDLDGFEFNIPTFFNKEKFKINVDLIDNKLTIHYLLQNPKFEYIFKIILGSFNKKRNKVVGIFNDNTLNLFNSFVDYINVVIDKNLKIYQEMELQSKGLIDFGDYFDIKYATDSEDKVYPDIYGEFEQPSDDLGKKKKGIFKK